MPFKVWLANGLFFAAWAYGGRCRCVSFCVLARALEVSAFSSEACWSLIGVAWTSGGRGRRANYVCLHVLRDPAVQMLVPLIAFLFLTVAWAWRLHAALICMELVLSFWLLGHPRYS